MCVSTSSGIFTSAHTVGLQLFGGLHALGYQIDAATFSGPNSMVLHVPATHIDTVATVSTSDAPDLIKDMAKLAAKRISPLAKGMSRGIGGGSSYRVQECGIFHVVVADGPDGVMEALRDVPIDRRPSYISQALLNSYKHAYPDYKLVMACFNNRELGKGQPLLFTYEPLDPMRIFAPGLDEHTGQPPRLGERMERNFRVIFGSTLPDATGIDLAPMLESYDNVAIRSLLGNLKIQGFHIDEIGPNGDFSLPASRLMQPYDSTYEHARSLYQVAANVAA